MFKWIRWFILVLVLVLITFLVFLFLFKDLIVERAAERAGTHFSGFRTQIDTAELDLVHFALKLKGIVILNPPGFNQKVFIESPEASASLDLMEFIQRKKLHVQDMKLNISEVNIERNKSGRFNFEGSQNDGPKPAPTKPGPGKPQPSAEPAMPFELDRLELTLRKVSYADYTTSIPQKVSGDLNIEKRVFEHLQSFDAAIDAAKDQLVHSNLSQVALAFMAGYGSKGGAQLGKRVQDTLGLGQAILQEGSGGLEKETANSLIQIVQQATVPAKVAQKGAVGTVKQAVNILNAVTAPVQNLATLPNRSAPLSNDQDETAQSPQTAEEPLTTGAT